MKKIILLIILFIPINIFALETPELNSNKFIIYDVTSKEVLNEFKAYENTSIASLTKIMTTITAIEKINNLEKSITITREMLNNIYWNASLAGLKVGDTLTYKDLLYASILPSGADATHALAYSLSGNIDNFLTEMNNLAKRIGLENTNFSNVIGLDSKNNYSTLYDIAKLLSYALENETFKEIYTTKNYTLSNNLEVKSTLLLFNKSMNLDISRIIGSKTGHTNNAGYCLSSLIKSNNHDIIIITGGASKINNNYYHLIDTINLIEYTDKLLEEKEEKRKLEEDALIKIKEQEKNKQKELIKIEKNRIYVNRTLIIGSVFIFCLVIINACKPKKKKVRK